MNRFFSLFCLVSGLVSFAFQPANALDLIDKKLQLNAMISLSYDYMDSDVGQAAADEFSDDNLLDDDIGYGGNPTRLNAEGIIPVNEELDFFYGVSKVVADNLILCHQVERHLHPVERNSTGNVSAHGVLIAALLRPSADEVKGVVTLKFHCVCHNFWAKRWRS